MEEQTDAHARLQSCCPAGKCYCSQELFPLEGAQQEPGCRAGHCPQAVPATATRNCHPAGISLHQHVPAWQTPHLARLWARICSRFAPEQGSPDLTGISSGHPTTGARASTTQPMSSTRGVGSLPPNYSSVPMDSGSKACSLRGEGIFLHHFATKHPTSAQTLL